VGQVLDGTWKTSPTKIWWGVKEGAIDFVSVADDVPEAAKKKLDEVKAGLKDGSLVIWKGPITDNTGKVALAKDKTADDEFLGGINFYVKGVEGKVPGGEKK
jgi:basic membrane protein A and related proteins